MKLTRPARALVLFSAIGLASLGAVAAWLEPDSRGFGTHRQLGMPECGILRLWGFRCPTCGMTTAWAYAVRGEVAAALSASIAGTLLALGAPFVGLWLLATGLRGQWCYLRPTVGLVFTLAATVVSIAMVDWIMRIWPLLS
jgi:hypothetical protein